MCPSGNALPPLEFNVELCGWCGNRMTVSEYTPHMSGGAHICHNCTSSFELCLGCGDMAYYTRMRHVRDVGPRCAACRADLITCAYCGSSCPTEGSENTADGIVCDRCIENYTHCSSCDELVNSAYTRRGQCGACRESSSDNMYRRGQMNTVVGEPTELFPKPRFMGLELEYLVTADEHPNVWNWGSTKEDGSLNDDEGTPVEFASRPCSGSSFEEMVNTVVPKLDSAAMADDSCGMHLHLDVSDTTEDERHNIFEWFKRTESVWFGMVDHNRIYSSYCKPVHRRLFSTVNEDRYHSLNTSAWFKHNTFELRLHHGTLDAKEILSFAATACNFIEAAKTAPPPLNTATNPREGPNSTEVQYLLDLLHDNTSVCSSILKKLSTYSSYTHTEAN